MWMLSAIVSRSPLTSSGRNLSVTDPPTIVARSVVFRHGGRQQADVVSPARSSGARIRRGAACRRDGRAMLCAADAGSRIAPPPRAARAVARVGGLALPGGPRRAAHRAVLGGGVVHRLRVGCVAAESHGCVPSPLAAASVWCRRGGGGCVGAVSLRGPRGLSRSRGGRADVVECA